MTVLVVDDHPLIQTGMGALLEAEPWVDQVVLASTNQDACRLAVNDLPGLAVVDLGLPDSHGVELIEQLRRSVPECAVVVLTMTSDAAVVRRCQRAGARGYLLKDTRPDAVLRVLAAVIEGAVVLGPRVRAEVLTVGEVPFTLRPSATNIPAHCLVNRGQILPDQRLVGHPHSLARPACNSQAINAHRRRRIGEAPLVMPGSAALPEALRTHGGDEVISEGWGLAGIDHP